MGQVTIYLEAEIEAKMRQAAKAMHVSQSKWIASLIKEKVADEWPESVLKLAGAWSDFPSAEEIRSTQGTDTVREEF
ncbi:CopG family transcriptional regulator [Candidatus Nitrospira salsa]|nr:MAG: hypothetical protein NPIRA01_36510 [Nitrospirales bacterium]